MPVDASLVPQAASYHVQHHLLDQYVSGDGQPGSVEALQQYFNQDPAVGGQYTGRWFERLDGGADAPTVLDRVTSADVLSVTFLSIADRLADVTIATTMTHTDEIANLLRQIPADLPMHQASWASYSVTSPAHNLWQLLRRCGGQDRWVMANKLLARKRPHLLPVYDSQVRSLLKEPRGYWACLWTWFADDPGRGDCQVFGVTVFCGVTGVRRTAVRRR